MKKVKRNFIEINKKSNINAWKSIMPLHIAYVAMGVSPAFQNLKCTNILYGLMINWAYQILAIGLICYFLKNFLTQSWRSFVSNSAKWNIKSVLGGFAICFVLYFFARFIVIALSIKEGTNQNQLNVGEYMVAFPLASMVLSLLLGPFTEECIYRGIIYQTLRNYTRVIANLGSALLFSSVHVISTIVLGEPEISQIIMLMMPYMVAGIGLGIVQEKYSNIWVNYFVHVLWNTMGAIPTLIVALMK